MPTGRAPQSSAKAAVAHKQCSPAKREDRGRQDKSQNLHMPEQRDHEPHEHDDRQAPGPVTVARLLGTPGRGRYT